MHRLVKIGVAAAFIIGGASTAFAVDAGVKAGAGVAAGATTSAGAGADLDATTTGSISGSFDSLMTSLNSTATVDLAAITDAADVKFVTVTALQGQAGADPAALDAALQSRTDAMATLHADINANAALKSKLEAAGYQVDDVIAVESGADGTFTFYIDDRA